MSVQKATAIARANIAFIKFWGQRDAELNLPANSSLSMNLAGLTTITTVEFSPDYDDDLVSLDGREARGEARQRIVAHLDRVRAMAGLQVKARVISENSFPVGAGLASSASGFAALSLAASRAAGLALSERELSILARFGSGSACRSIPGGFTEWTAGTSSEDSFARQIAPPEHWELRDVIAIISRAHKPVGSIKGHALAPSSHLYQARVASVADRLAQAKAALLEKDLATLGPLIEEDAISMHAVMMTSRPPIYYWLPGSIQLIHQVQSWRAEGLEVYFTFDAGPNVHLICQAADQAEVERRLRDIAGMLEVIVSGPGPEARVVESF
ncbi:MAG: diphosphomevalonate decarboxylase [Chloroflexi bacterium]|nr:diphosphomevalonate decarboxylase [Chloroflexota bacterium]